MENTAKIIGLSKKGDYAKVAIETTIGPVVSQLAGWMKVASKKVKIGDSFELPKGCEVYTETRGDFVALIIK